MQIKNNFQTTLISSIYNKEWFFLLILIFLTTFVILWKLGQGSLEDWDEAIHAQVAKEFIQSGDWLTPHWNYKPYFRKPPLSMWSTATFFNFFGVSEFSARATSAFSGIGLVIVTYSIAKLIYSKSVGYLAILILLTSYAFLEKSRFGTTDVLLTLLIFLSIYGYLRLRQGNQKWWYLVWISFGLAFMVKGMGAIIIPSAITISILLDRNSSITLRSKYVWQGFFFALLIVLPWHIFMIVQHGIPFINDYFGYQVIARINRPIEGHIGDIFYYIWTLKRLFFPWFYLVPFALVINLKENLKFSHASLILLVVFCLVFGGYSLVVKTKIDWYIFPVYPILAILIASMLKKIMQLDLLTNKKINYKLILIVMFAIFMFVGLRQVKPLYYKQETSIAKLGHIVESKNYNYNKRLIIRGIDEPAILYYSNIPVILAESPEKLAKYTEDGRTHEMVITEKDIKNLGISYEFKIITKIQPLVYGTIQKISRSKP